MTARTGTPALAVEDLRAGYGRTLVLDRVTFAVPVGARFVVLGRNGVGKTTLMRALVGQATVVGGRIRLGGEDVTHLGSDARARRGLGYVPQTRDVFRSLTVEENLLVALKERPPAAVEEAYALFPALKARRRHGAGQLSGGEQQMLSVARALLGDPSVLLLDEPLEGLAPVICDEVMAALASQRERTIVMVEQQIERALAFADSVLILMRGEVAWSGSPAELAADPERIERYLGVGLRA